MKRRINVSELSPGLTLDAPLYDESNTLLLARGIPLTSAMMTALRRTQPGSLYLGESSSRPLPPVSGPLSTPVTAMIKEAEAASEQLRSHIESELKGLNLDVAPSGNPFEKRVDDTFHETRPAARFEAWRLIADTGTELVSNIIGGTISNDHVASAAKGIIDDAIGALAVDRSLLANMVNVKSVDAYLNRHSMNTAMLAIQIATSLKFERKSIQSVGIAALLQDLGMAMVPEAIVNAPRSLSASEFVDIQKHSVHALYALEKIKGLPYDTRFIAYQCHERADGTGYPAQKHKSLIHKLAQVVAVADAYDALTSDRPWRKAYSPYHAMEVLIKEASAGKYDGEIVRGLLEYLSLFPIGSLINLSNGDMAKVVHSNRKSMGSPVVSLLLDKNGEPYETPRSVNLLDQPTLTVDSIAKKDMFIELTDGF